MGSLRPAFSALLCLLLLVRAFAFSHACSDANPQSEAHLKVNAASRRKMPDNLFGIFFEEINHAGAGGLWAELVSNRGFEAGGQHSPACINPWGRIGDDKSIYITTDLTSRFARNKVALRMDVLCHGDTCPEGGVGVFNPGYAGMNIEKGKSYRVEFHVRASESINIKVSLTSSDGSKVLASDNVVNKHSKVKKWKKVHLTLKAESSDSNATLRLTTTKKGQIWLDQVSAMPTDTYKGHGFRKDLMEMLLALKPKYLRFPGGCYVEGNRLMNAFRWKETVGPWEERPGHYGDVWNYWSDDALGYLEYLQLAEDLGATPVWVINNGIGHLDSVDTTLIAPFVQEMLDSIEFARGDCNSTWGSLRAKMGHPEPFHLKHIAIGNEDCWKPSYIGNYLAFYAAVKRAYPDIQVITNCDIPFDYPADLYDFHTYTSPQEMFKNAHLFDQRPRSGPKAFVSEYAVTDPDGVNDNGTLIGAISEAAFLIGIERNSDIVEMASYAPLFALFGHTQWKPDAIFFNSREAYGIPSYWMQTFFIDSSGATLLDLDLQSNSTSVIASAISYVNKEDNKNYIKIKIANFQEHSCNVKISLEGVDANSIMGSKLTELASNKETDENTFANPTKVAPRVAAFNAVGREMNVVVHPYSLTALDLEDQSKSNHQGRKVNPGKKR
ncbi:hypothetical protein Ancab_038999 [Ancistrocladus abbreviatus]